MNAAGEEQRLPRSVGGVIAFALAAWTANAPLYLALALAVFAAYGAAERFVPDAVMNSPQGQFKIYVLVFTGLFADAFVVAAVALGVAARGGEATVSPRELLALAIERWLPVIAVTALAQAIQIVTAPLDGLGSSAIPRPLLYVAAPLTWILWGILALTGPLVALTPQRGIFSVMEGFVRAFVISLHRNNVLRLCVLAIIALIPVLAQTLLQSTLEQRHIQRAFFWANAPIDALTIGPWSAMLTAFTLDFARRAAEASERR